MQPAGRPAVRILLTADQFSLTRLRAGEGEKSLGNERRTASFSGLCVPLPLPLPLAVPPRVERTASGRCDREKCRKHRSTFMRLLARALAATRAYARTTLAAAAPPTTSRR